MVQDLGEVVNGLNEALNTLIAKIMNERGQLDRLKLARENTIRAHVAGLLPNLETATLNELRKLDGFVTRQKESLFDAAGDIKIPFWVRVGFKASRYRVEQFQSQFNLLCVHLTSFIARDASDSRFENVRELGRKIDKLQSSINDLEQKKETLKLDRDEASQTYKNLQTKHEKIIQPELAQKIGSIADNLRTVRKKQSNSNVGEVRFAYQRSADPVANDNTDLILWWALDIPTSERTFVMDMVFHDHNNGHGNTLPSVEFQGEGGSSGGGGASGSFDILPATPDQNPSQDPDPVLVASTIATDDSLGRYS